MAEKTDDLYLNHIKDACRLISDYLKNIDRENFETNKLVQDAVMKELEIIGEAARKVSNSTKDNYKLVYWKQIVGMRDKLIHDYTGVDLNIVWESATVDIPELLKNLTEN
jgi:uncharacterized protein with HEPN domain